MSGDSVVEPRKSTFQVPGWLLIGLLVAFAIGVAGGLGIQNLLVPEQISFSTADLISFVFTVALGGAAIILAAVTIVLSRHAEDALIRRSDEGIRLQNDVFVRTNEVLSRIEASTGVTERRIEDMISGRAGPIVREALSASNLGDAGVSEDVAEKITEDITRRLSGQLGRLMSSSPSSTEAVLAQMKLEQRKAEEASKAWSEFRSAVMEELGGVDGIKVVHDGEGQLSAKGRNFWDGIVEVDGKQAGIDIHTRAQFVPPPDGSGSFLHTAPSDLMGRLVWRAQEDDLERVFIVVDEDAWEHEGLAKVAEAADRVNARGAGPEIVRLSGSPQSIARRIAETAGNGQSA